MYAFLMTVHIGNCLLLILVVLLQAGRGAGLAVFGGGGDAIFASPSGSTFMRKLTSGMAVTFGVTSLMLTLLGGRVGIRSVTRKALSLPPVSQGAAPAAAPGASRPAGQ